MAKKAVKNGISHLLCTPHHNHYFNNPKDKVIELVKDLQQELDKRAIPLHLFSGQEVRIHRFLMYEIKNNKILFADITDRYLMLEFPNQDIPVYAIDLLTQMIEQGITPVIVHPERYYWVHHNQNVLQDFLNLGCLAQLIAPSLVGKYGVKLKKVAYELIENNLVHMIASDAHGLKTRNFYLKEAFDIVRKKYGQEKVDYFQNVARAVLNGDDVF